MPILSVVSVSLPLLPSPSIAKKKVKVLWCTYLCVVNGNDPVEPTIDLIGYDLVLLKRVRSCSMSRQPFPRLRHHVVPILPHITSFSSTSLTLAHIWSVSQGSSTAPPAVSPHCLPLAVPHRPLPCEHGAWFDQVGTCAAETHSRNFCSPHHTWSSLQ